MALLTHFSLYLMHSLLYAMGIAMLAAVVTVGPATYVHRVLIAIDQFGTVLLGGWPGETMSSYAYRLDQQRKIGGQIFRPAIDALFFWQVMHCREAYIGMLQRVNLPPEFRV